MTSDDHEGLQRPGVPRCGPARGGANACHKQRRTRGRAGVVLCGNDAGLAKVGNWSRSAWGGVSFTQLKRCMAMPFARPIVI
jgi:hypothetical protein